MDCGEEQLARLRQRYRVHGSEEIWVMADAHLWHRSAWRKGTLVVFRTKLGFSEECALFTGEPLLEVSFSETAASAPPAVRKIDDHPLHSNEVEPYQLLVPCARLGEVPDTGGVKGAALRGFDIDPINPKRIGRVLLFLWELQHGRLSEDHRLMWAAVRRDHEGHLVHRTDLNCVLSSVMFRSTHEMLARQGSRGLGKGAAETAEARASVPVLLQDIGRAKERLEQRIEDVVRGEDAAAGAASLDAEARIAELEEDIERKEAQIDSLEVVCGRFVGFVDEGSDASHLRTTAPPGSRAGALQTAEVVITNRRLLYHTLSRSDFREAAEEASDDTGNNDAGYGEDHLASAKFFFDSLGVPTPVTGARGGGAPPLSTNPSPFAQEEGEDEDEDDEGASEAKQQPADRRRFRSLWYGDMTAVYKLSEEGATGAAAHKNAADDAGDLYGSPSQRAFSPAGTAGAGSPGAGSVEGVNEIFDPFIRPTEWAMDSGGQRVGAPQVNPSALKVVVNTDGAGHPSQQAPAWRARTYVIRASDDVRRYHHGVIEAKWLTHCRRDVRHVNCGLAHVLGEAVRTAECRWATQRTDKQEGSANFLARSAMLPKKRTHSYGAPSRARLARWATNRVIRRLSTQRKTTSTYQPSPFDDNQSLGALLCTAPAGVAPLELDLLGRSQTTPGLDDVFGSPTVLPPPASAELRPTNVEFRAVDSPTGAETPVLQLPPTKIDSPSSAAPEQVHIVFTPPDNNMLDAQVSVVLSAGSSCSSEEGRSGFAGTGCTRPCAKSLLEVRSYDAASDEGLLPTDDDDGASSQGDDEEEEEDEDAANLELVGSCRASNVTVEFSLRMLSLWSTRRLLNHFQSIDVSGDGFVGLEEFRAALAPLFRSEELPAAFFRVFDAGGNGMLSFDGFLAGMTMLLQGHADKASFLFLLFDSDSDGVLTGLQFREVVALFLQLNGLHAGLIDTQCTDATMLAARLFHAIERADPDALNLVEFREALLHNAVVRPAFKRLQQHSDTVGALSSLIFDSLLEDEVAAATPAGPPFARRKAARKGSGGLVADVLAYSSDVAESLRPHHLITFGHEDWHLLVDLLDGLREATRKCITPLGVPATGKQGEGTAADYAAHSEDINVFVKSGDAPACFVYQKIDASHPDTRDAAFRGISDSVGPVLFIDHAPQVFRRIRELGGITSSAFLESLGLSEILLNMLIGSASVLHHYIASGTSHGEFFLVTNDRRFVIKTVSDKQKKILKRMLPRYVAYLQDEPNTLLPKYYAMATIKRGNVKLNVVVMGRVLDPEREVRQLYDLKARFTSALPCRLPEGNRKGAIMADIDLRRSLELDIEWHEQLLDQVAEDLAFLRENQLSGYSVLIGTDSDMPFGADPGSSPVDPVARMRRVKDRLQEDHPTSLLANLRRLKQNATCCCSGRGDARGPDDDGNEPYGTENGADAAKASPADAAVQESEESAAAAVAAEAATPEGPKPFLSTFDTPLEASFWTGPHAGLNRSASSLSHLAPGVSGAAQLNTPPCSRAVQFQDGAAATLRLRASTPLGSAEPASRAHSAGVTTESVGRCSEAEAEAPALQHPQHPHGQQQQPPLRRSFTAPGRSVHGLREMLVEVDELQPSAGSIHRTTPLFRTRRRRSSVLRQVSKEHVLAVMANTYVGERFMTEGHEKRKQQRLQTRGHERSVFQRHHGGVPSSCGKESFFLGIVDILHEGKTRSEAEAYSKRFLAYLELVCERKHQPKLLNLAELPSDVQFVGYLESNTKVRLSVDVPRKLLHVTNVPRKGSNKVRRICEPYSLTAQTFSVEKPIDKRRLCSVVLRGPALLTPSQGSGVPRLAFERKRAVVFRTAAEREEFCSVVSMLGRAKEAGVKSGQSTVGLKVFSGTWNVGERPPGRKEELNGWLGFGRECDVVSVAAQECDYKPRRPFESCEVDWFHAVYEVLNDKQVGDEKYVMVDGITMWQMRLVVFVKVKHANKVSDVVSFQEATGIAHVGGNKGGVAIGFKFMESPMLFVGCHLAAHQEYLRRRHSDMQDIIAGVSAHIGTPDVQVTNEYPHIFIAGDLNYRIDTKEDSRKLCMFLTRERNALLPPPLHTHTDAPSSPHYQKITLQDRRSVYDAIVKEEWASLRANDQLRKAMAGETGRAVLPHFLEAGPLTLDSGEGKGRLVECPCFPPTFKVFSKFHKAARAQRIDVVNDYQGFGQGGTTRVPSWCDRVLRNNLFSNRIERDVSTLHYNSCRTVVTSDHKPVYAIMSLRAREQYLFEKRSGSSLPAKRGLGHNRRSSVVCTRAMPVIQLYNLQGTNLMPADPNGKSDPYVVVLTNFCTANIATEVQPVTLNPQWRETVTILPEFGDLEYVRTEYIYFVLFDKDSIGSDDPLGQAVLCLEEFTGAKIAGSEFKIPVYVAVCELSRPFACRVLSPIHARTGQPRRHTLRQHRPSRTPTGLRRGLEVGLLLQEASLPAASLADGRPSSTGPCPTRLPRNSTACTSVRGQGR